MKFRLLLITAPVVFLLWVLATAVMAQEEPPPPYAGLKNMFPWSDASAQEAGKKLYQQSCQACHGINGGNIAGADFSQVSFSPSLEESSDYYFWILSEGRLDKGMPPYESSFSEEQRWQVLTYLWSFGTPAPLEVTPLLTQPLAGEGKGLLLLTVPEQAPSGQPVTISAVLQDKEGKPVGNVPVKFSIRVDFFASGLMEIGEAVTNGQGVAVVEYTPRQTGDIQIVARYEGDGPSPVETTAMFTLVEVDEPFYQPETGIQLPVLGEEVFIGPESALELGEMGEAPTSAFRLPGGILSWLLLIAATVMLIWFTYFRVMYQVFRIPIVSEIRDTNTRLVPLVALVTVVALGIFLVLLLITGPYSHFHLPR